EVAVAIPFAGTPYLAYRDEASLSLRLVRCSNRSCSKSEKPIEIASGDVGYEPAMIIGREGFPIVAYRDGEKSTVVVIACHDVACGERSTTVVDNGGDKADKVGFNLVMVRSAASNPVIVYRNDSQGQLKVVECADGACSADKRVVKIIDGVAPGSKMG